VTFLRRLFARDEDAPWVTRWPGVCFEPWDGGAGEADERESLRKIAATCGGAELRKVVAHGDESAVLAALDNPALTLEMVGTIATSLRSGPNLLAAVARRRDWSGDPQIAKSLCVNPKTPFFATRALLSHLPMSELREISTNSLVPPGLAQEALAMINKKRTKRMR
jgi:hypothetical protein